MALLIGVLLAIAVGPPASAWIATERSFRS